MGKYTAIGGQALIEGIMMKSPEKTAMGVRIPDGTIDITYFEGKSIREKYKILKLPIIRGVVGFVESMVQGYKALMLSADKSGFTDFEEETQKDCQEVTADENTDKSDSDTEKKKDSKLLTVVMIIGTVLGVALSVVLFMLIPRLCVSGLEFLFSTQFSKFVRSGIEQLLKLSVFVLYVYLVSFMKDIKRVFMYHGAEHKTIFCYEQGLELTVENVRNQKRFHPRCGTSFIVLVVIVGIILGGFIQIDNVLLRTLVRIILVPLIVGIGYELIKFAGRHDNILTKIISAPGVWLQHITTKEPEDSMIECAIKAVNEVIPEDKEKDNW